MNILKNIGLILIFIIGIIVHPILWLVSLFVSKDKGKNYHNVRNFKHHSCNCDIHWTESFYSQTDFEKFEKTVLIIFKPLNHTRWYIPKPCVQFLCYEYGAVNPKGGFIYQCKICNQLWELSSPDNANRGYFKGINLDSEKIIKFLV